MRLRIFILVVLLGIAAAAAGRSVIRRNFKLASDSNVLQSFGQSSAPELSKEFTVLIWNIYKGSRDAWEADFKKLIEGAELVLIQEAFLKPSILNLFSKSRDLSWRFAASFSYQKSRASTGVATGSKAACESVDFLRSPGRELIVGTPKMSILTVYKLSGVDDSLLVVNTHGNLSVPAAVLLKQYKQAARRIALHRGPVIWAGDFNTWSKHRLRMLNALAKELGLSPVSFKSGLRTAVLFGPPIDHAYIRGLNVVDAKVYSEIDSSDHKALGLRLKVSDG